MAKRQGKVVYKKECTYKKFTTKDIGTANTCKIFKITS